MSRLGGLVAVAFVAATLAGCFAADRSDPKSSTPTQVDANQGGGAIIGFVVDDEAFPLEGAYVQVGDKANVTSGIHLQTDRAGFFEVVGLGDGTYLVVASMAGYAKVEPREVNVVEGETARVRFVLERDVQYEARTESTHLKAVYYTEVCVGAVLYVCPTSYQYLVRPYPPNSSFNKQIKEAQTGPIETIFAEISWVPSHSACPGQFYNFVLGPGYLDEQDYDDSYWSTNASGMRNPSRLVIPRDAGHENDMYGEERTEDDGDHIKTSGRWLFYAYPYPYGGGTGSVYCHIDQTIDIWYSFFYGQPAPSLDWSAIPK